VLADIQSEVNRTATVETIEKPNQQISSPARGIVDVPAYLGDVGSLSYFFDKQGSPRPRISAVSFA
jgi:hypothetical protein